MSKPFYAIYTEGIGACQIIFLKSVGMLQQRKTDGEEKKDVLHLHSFIAKFFLFRKWHCERCNLAFKGSHFPI